MKLRRTTSVIMELIINWKMIKLMVREKMMKIIKNGDDEDEDAGVD